MLNVLTCRGGGRGRKDPFNMGIYPNVERANGRRVMQFHTILNVFRFSSVFERQNDF